MFWSSETMKARLPSENPIRPYDAGLQLRLALSMTELNWTRRTLFGELSRTRGRGDLAGGL